MDNSFLSRVITPEVNAVKEFQEICNDFSDPMEVFRESISNAYDVFAENIWIKISMDYDDVVIEIRDDGEGMSEEVLMRNFWDLGNSKTAKIDEKNKKGLIGEKGHGTKIFLKSKYISVWTKEKGKDAFESICETPETSLRRGDLHSPMIQKSKESEKYEQGTLITLRRYNENSKKFHQNQVKDYVKWFTKIGSIEKQFNKNKNEREIRLWLDCFKGEYEEIDFGHFFPPESPSMSKLIDQYQENAYQHYCKRHHKEDVILKSYGNTKVDFFISVESEEVKRSYNTMLKDRLHKKSEEEGKYKVSSRYGLWLCKDYIPIRQINEWVSGFGTGSQSYLLLHGFLNCQDIKLTANRGDFSNTDPQLIEEIKEKLSKILEDIDIDLDKEGYFWLTEESKGIKNRKQEDIDFTKRKNASKKRNPINIRNLKFYEPQNEAETVLIFQTLYTLYPNEFDFEPLDYATQRGIDMLARSTNKSEDSIFYVEFKYKLSAKGFNHSFDKIRRLVCWDCDLKSGTEMESTLEENTSTFKIEGDKYFIDREKRDIRISVIKLKEIVDKLNL